MKYYSVISKFASEKPKGRSLLTFLDLLGLGHVILDVLRRDGCALLCITLGAFRWYDFFWIEGFDGIEIQRYGDSAWLGFGNNSASRDAENLPNGRAVIGQIRRKKPRISIWIQVLRRSYSFQPYFLAVSIAPCYNLAVDPGKSQIPPLLVRLPRNVAYHSLTSSTQSR